MGGYQRPEGGWRFTFLGMKTDTPPDAVDPRQYPYAQNVRSVEVHTVQTRPGYSTLFTTPDSSAGPLDIVTACPTDEPVVGEEYFYELLATGGVPPYSWLITAGGLPPGISLSTDGIISGIRLNDSSSGTWTATVTDSNIPPDSSSITCEFTGATLVIDMAFYIESSPRVEPDGLATRYMYILPPSRDKLFRTIGPYVGGVPGDWSVWEIEAIPAGSWRRIYGCNFTGSAIGFADDATMMSKALCTLAADPYPQADNPWIAYPLNVPAKATSGNPTIVPDPFWTPDLEGRAALGYIGTDEFLHSQRNPDPLTCITFDVIDEGTNELPTGRVWNHVLSRQNAGGDEFLGVLVVGVGTKFARWLDGASSWTLVDCPDGDWRCSAVSYGSNTLLAVGIGDNNVSGSLDYGITWTVYTPLAGWTPVNPRVVFDPNLNTAETQGTFVVTGGTVDGAEAVMLVPLNNDDSLGTAVLAGLPTLSSTTVLRACSTMVQTVGLMITGFDTAFAVDDPDGIIIVVNPELSQSGSPATYDDFHLRTIAQTPFGGLT